MGWTRIIPFCAKKQEKAIINKNTETLIFSVLCAKLLFPPQIQLFFQNTYLHENFFFTSLLKSPLSIAEQENLVVSRTITCWHWGIYIFTCKKNKRELVRRFLSIRVWRRTVSSWVFYTLHAKASNSYLQLKSNNISNLDNSLTRWKRPIFKIR